jgi:hypothetical protein
MRLFADSANRDAQPRVQPDPPVRALFLASVGGGRPVNLVLLGLRVSAFDLSRFGRQPSRAGHVLSSPRVLRRARPFALRFAPYVAACAQAGGEAPRRWLRPNMGFGYCFARAGSVAFSRFSRPRRALQPHIGLRPRGVDADSRQLAVASSCLVASAGARSPFGVSFSLRRRCVRRLLPSSASAWPNRSLNRTRRFIFSRSRASARRAS